MTDNDRIQSLLKQSLSHKKNLNYVEEQKALFGISSPPDLINRIDYEKDELSRIKKELLELGYQETDQTSEKLYIDYIVELYENLDSIGVFAESETLISVLLKDIYVNLDAQLITQEISSEESTSSVPDFFELPASDVINAIKKSRGVVLLGEPGSGKSTLLRMLTLSLARKNNDELFDLEKGYLPVPISALDLYEIHERYPDLNFPTILAKHFSENQHLPVDLEPNFRNALNSGSLFLMIDGLDELDEIEKLSSLVTLIRKMYAWYSNTENKLVITSRVSTYRQLPIKFVGMNHFIFTSLTSDKMLEITKNWLRLMNKEFSDSEIESLSIQFMVSVWNSPALLRLASNPLLLTMVLILQRKDLGSTLRRTELFESYITLLSRTWNYTRSIGSVRPKSQDDILVSQVLSTVAFWMRDNSSSEITKEHLIRLIGKYFEISHGVSPHKALEMAIDFMDVQNSAAALLDTRSSRKFRFVHKSFEEYLAAKNIISNYMGSEFNQFVIQKIGNSEWEDTLVFAISLLAIEYQDENLLNSLFDELLATENIPYENKLITIGKCCLEIGRDFFDTKGWEKWSGKLAQAVESKDVSLSSRIILGNILSWVGDPRFITDEPEMILIQSGAFQMGSNYDEIENTKNIVREIYSLNTDTIAAISNSLDSEHPKHDVNLPSFYISKYPITNAQYKIFVDETGYKAPKRDETWAKPYNWHESQYPIGKSNHPVVMVSWYNAIEYCKWLSSKTGKKYRLPAEAEWEKSARGRSNNLYPWGGTWISKIANTLEESESFIPASTDWSESGFHPGGKEDNLSEKFDMLIDAGSSPVGVYCESNSEFGVSDLGGNCWEWVDDWYKPYPGNKTKNERFGEKYKVMRGSAWSSHYIYARCAYRGTYDPHNALFEDGFRIALDFNEHD